MGDGLARGERATLNASPALGPDEIAIADSEGTVFGVPYDWCLRARTDRRCQPGAPLPRNQARVLWTSPFGITSEHAPRTIDANQPLAFSLDVRAANRTRLALIDPRSVRVQANPHARLRTDVSGDRRYLVVTPRQPLARSQSDRDQRPLPGRPAAQRAGDDRRRARGAVPVPFPLPGRARERRPHPAPVPSKTGDPSGVWLLNRLALPLPSLLPSYNQIGFDSLDFLVGLVGRERGGRAVAWLVGANDPPRRISCRSRSTSATGCSTSRTAAARRWSQRLRHRAGELEHPGARGRARRGSGPAEDGAHGGLRQDRLLRAVPGAARPVRARAAHARVRRRADAALPRRRPARPAARGRRDVRARGRRPRRPHRRLDRQRGRAQRRRAGPRRAHRARRFRSPTAPTRRGPPTPPATSTACAFRSPATPRNCVPCSWSTPIRPRAARWAEAL